MTFNVNQFGADCINVGNKNYCGACKQELFDTNKNCPNCNAQINLNYIIQFSPQEWFRNHTVAVNYTELY